jgi:hypothetical protein
MRFIGAASSQTDTARAQDVRRPKCEKETFYQTANIRTTDKAPRWVIICGAQGTCSPPGVAPA